MKEAIASSQLEGAATTRKVAKEMLENNRKPSNSSEQMILNNYQAMKWIVANQNVEFTIEAIQKIHSILTNSTLNHREDEGAFRKVDDIKVVDVQTGASVYTPPSSQHLNNLMSDFCSFANDLDKENFFLHPISKAIILHFLIGYIHPFVDGNGRTARTVFYWYLLKHGYWLTEFLSVSRIILTSKAQYARAYLHTERDENDLTYKLPALSFSSLPLLHLPIYLLCFLHHCNKFLLHIISLAVCLISQNDHIIPAKLMREPGLFQQ